MASFSSCLFLPLVLSTAILGTPFLSPIIPVSASSTGPCITSADCSTNYIGTSTCFLRECLECVSDVEVPFYNNKSACSPVCDGPGVLGDQQCMSRVTDGDGIHCFQLSGEPIEDGYNGYIEYNGTATYKNSEGELKPIEGFCGYCPNSYIFDPVTVDCVEDPNAPAISPSATPSGFGGAPPASVSNPSPKSKKSNTPAIVGSIFGVLIFVGLAAGITYFIIKRKRK